MKSLDLIGHRFGRLLVQGRTKHVYGSGIESVWLCDCECGNTIKVPTARLRNGKTRSCGCLALESRKLHSGKSQITHGMTNSSEYRVWGAMNNRCSNPKNPNYPHYGGRGITVCDEWKNSFEAFYRDMGPRPSLAHTIDRKDNNGNYCKENCRWATKKEQANNRNCTPFYDFRGERLPITEIARRLNLSIDTIRSRLSRGMSEERAFSEKLFNSK